MKVVAEFGGLDFRLERTRFGPSNDTLQRVLPLILERMGPETAWPCFQTCRAWRMDLEARGFCRRTWQLCSTLASGNITKSVRVGGAADDSDESSSEEDDSAEERSSRQRLKKEKMLRIHECLAQKVLRRLEASTTPDERTMFLDATAFLQRSWMWKGTLHEWLQAASQEPDASFLSRGAASTVEILGLPLVQWGGKPQGRYPGLFTLTSHARSVAFSPDGKMIVSGGADNLVKIWNADTGAKVSFCVVLNRAWKLFHLLKTAMKFITQYDLYWSCQSKRVVILIEIHFFCIETVSTINRTKQSLQRVSRGHGCMS